MNIKNKKILIILIMAILTAMALPSRVNAGLQANKGGTSLVNTTAGSFFEGIRRMEMQNGTLGKSAVLDDKYLDTTNNGIDCHMELNTEYGTAVILAYSVYGNKPTKENDTTTGNASGIKEIVGTNTEYVAVGGTSSYTISKILNADSRYKNKATETKGDAAGILGFSWNGYAGYTFPTIVRGGVNGALYISNSNGYASLNVTSRAVVVCGERILMEEN